MKEKCLAFWKKHPIIHLLVAYPVLIIFFAITGLINAIKDGIKAFFETGANIYDELKYQLKNINKQSEKNRKSLKEKLQSRVQKV